MNSLLKNLGLIIFLCGVICLCVYYFIFLVLIKQGLIHLVYLLRQ